MVIPYFIQQFSYYGTQVVSSFVCLIFCLVLIKYAAVVFLNLSLHIDTFILTGETPRSGSVELKGMHSMFPKLTIYGTINRI